MNSDVWTRGIGGVQGWISVAISNDRLHRNATCGVMENVERKRRYQQVAFSCISKKGRQINNKCFGVRGYEVKRDN